MDAFLLIISIAVVVVSAVGLTLLRFRRKPPGGPK